MVSLRAQITGDEMDSAPAKDVHHDVHHIDEVPDRVALPDTEAPRRGAGMLVFAGIMAAFWAGAACAYLWGYFGVQGLVRLDPQLLSFIAIVTFLPPLLIIASAYAMSRAGNSTATRATCKITEAVTRAARPCSIRNATTRIVADM